MEWYNKDMRKIEATCKNIASLISSFATQKIMARAMENSPGIPDGPTRDRRVHYKYFQYLKSGNCNPTLETLYRIANATGMTITISPQARNDNQ